MPAAGSIAAFSATIAARAGTVGNLAREAQDAVDDGIRGIARKAARRTAQLTPRSAGTGPHVADAWVTEEKVTPTGIEVRVYNNSEHGTAPIILLDGGRTNLVTILEYGSMAHIIEARNAPFLVFFWPKLGRTVFAKRVEHPGTRPYSMVFTARSEADIDMKRLFDSVRTVVRLTIAGRTGVLTGARNPFRGAA